MIRLYANDERELYLQLADEIIRLIAEGHIHDQDEMPSVRKLATELRVNPKTVQHAYQRLADRGILQLRHKATAIVDLQQMQTAEWLALWSPVIQRFITEAQARGLKKSDAEQWIVKEMKQKEEFE